MLDVNEYISQIMMRLNKAADATGLERSLLLVEIGKMILTLQDGIGNQDKAHEEEKKFLQSQIDELNKRLLGNPEEVIGGETFHFDLDPRHQKEENQNGSNSGHEDAVSTESNPG